MDSESGRKEFEIESIRNETEMVAYERQVYLEKQRKQQEQQAEQQSSEGS